MAPQSAFHTAAPSLDFWLCFLRSGKMPGLTFREIQECSSWIETHGCRGVTFPRR